MAMRGAYGTWPSVVTSHAAAQAVGLRTVAIDPAGNAWWDEVRPAEEGRSAILRMGPGGEATEVLAAELEELGAHRGLGSWLPLDQISMVVAHDQGLHLVRSGQRSRTLTAGAPGAYRDLVPGPGGRSVWCVRDAPGHAVQQQAMVSVPLDGSGAVRTLATTTGAMGTPRPSPDGGLLAWLAWDHPQMPWDGSELRVTNVVAGGESRAILGGTAESVFQPEWASPDSLYVISDRSRWWNPYEVDLGGTLRPLVSMPDDFGWPQWEDDLATYGRLADGRLAVLHGTDDWRLDVVDPATSVLMPLDLPYTSWQPRLHTRGDIAIGIAGSPTQAASLIAINTATRQHRVLQHSTTAVPPEYTPPSEWATFAGRDGHQVHAVVHPAHNPDFHAAEGEPVPYLLVVRDCPSDRAARMLDASTVFFTSRGIGVADVLCRGASGFGRGYREQVYGRWGVADVEDCVVVGRGLVQRYGADPARLVVRGTGTGGATALGVLAHTNLCAGGTIYAGVTDLDLLALYGDHHEADHLLALAADSTLQRDPWWLEGIRSPVLVLHGTRDQVVPLSQSQLLYEALRRNSVPHASIAFPDEGHRFRRADTTSRALEAELAFYGRTLGFAPADVPPLILRSS